MGYEHGEELAQWVGHWYIGVRVQGLISSPTLKRYLYTYIYVVNGNTMYVGLSIIVLILNVYLNFFLMDTNVCYESKREDKTSIWHVNS